ncbi:tenascin-R-like, partial [Lampetra planeri]
FPPPLPRRTDASAIDGPRAFEVREVTDSYAHLSWERSRARVTSLHLSYRTTGDARPTELGLRPTATEYTLQGLRPGRLYHVTLRAERGLAHSGALHVSFTTGRCARTTDGRIWTRTDGYGWTV